MYRAQQADAYVKTLAMVSVSAKGVERQKHSMFGAKKRPIKRQTRRPK
jgi:hypothetical protein